MDFFDSMAGSFELENAVAASPAGSAPAARGAQDWRTVPLRSPEPTTFPTCASACMALQQKRAACLREVPSRPKLLLQCRSMPICPAEHSAWICFTHCG